MTDGEALLKAILEFPDADDPRLIYADWLQEDGRSRLADFIRRGVRAPLRVEIVDNVPHRLVDRGSGKFLAQWSRLPVRGWLPDPLATHRFDAKFRRGFLDAIECPADWWIAHADTLVAQQPLKTVALKTEALSSDRSDHVSLPLTWYAERWPSVTFSQLRIRIVEGLDIYPDPLEHLPLEGWRITIRRDRFEPEVRRDGFGPEEGLIRGDLSLRASGPPAAGPEGHGAVFGPVVAVDPSGARWQCRAMFSGVTLNVDNNTTTYEARSSGEIVPATST